MSHGSLSAFIKSKLSLLFLLYLDNDENQSTTIPWNTSFFYCSIVLLSLRHIRVFKSMFNISLCGSAWANCFQIFVNYLRADRIRSTAFKNVCSGVDEGSPDITTQGVNLGLL